MTLARAGVWFLAAAALALVVGAGVLATSGEITVPFLTGDDHRYHLAGEDLIHDELVDQIGLGPLDASCGGRGLGPGDTFACTAEAVNHPPIEFTATISDDGDRVDMTSTNLLLADQVEQVEAFAASLIADDIDLPIEAGDFECADNSLVVGAGETIDCLATRPTDGTIFQVFVTVEDLQTLSITVDVGEAIG